MLGGPQTLLSALNAVQALPLGAQSEQGAGAQPRGVEVGRLRYETLFRIPHPGKGSVKTSIPVLATPALTSSVYPLFRTFDVLASL